jgi:predicted transcriptional regulator
MSEPRAGPRGRTGTVAITAHLPKEVRDRLKILAIRLNRTMNDLMRSMIFSGSMERQTDDQRLTAGIRSVIDLHNEYG